MHFASLHAFIATAYWTIGARALPYANPGPTYSVVDVGGPSSTDDAATIYETVSVPQSAHMVTQTGPAATVTATPDGPIIPHVEPSLQVISMTATTELSVTISVAASSSASSVVDSSTSSWTTSSCTSTSTSSTTLIVPTWTSTLAAYSTSSSTWSSTTPTAIAPTGIVSYATAPSMTPAFAPQATGGFAKPSGWAAPWNLTNGHVPQGYAAPSGVLPSGYAARATPVPPTIAYVS